MMPWSVRWFAKKRRFSHSILDVFSTVNFAAAAQSDPSMRCSTSALVSSPFSSHRRWKSNFSISNSAPHLPPTPSNAANPLSISSKLTAVASAEASSSNTSSTSSSSGRGAGRRATFKSGLQAIKGVGPHYENLLLQRGVTCVQKLQEHLHLDFAGDKARLRKFLQEEVGIKNSQHCNWVAEHVEGLEWAPPRSRVTLAVEGNIGAGKSTFLNMLSSASMRDMLSMSGSDTMELRDVVQVVPEPVDEWQMAKGKDPQGRERTFNLLEKFYSDPQRYAFTFQNYVLMSRIRRERDTRDSSSAPLRVLERSIFSDRMVFVRAMHEAGRMEDWELGLYDSWFNIEMQHDRQLAPTGFIYLRASPDTCMQRMKRRARSEETGVEPAYLEQLHRHHEDWLMTSKDPFAGYLSSTVGGGGSGVLGGSAAAAAAAAWEGYHQVGVKRAADGLYQATTELVRSLPTPQQRLDSAVLSAAGSSGGLRLFHPQDAQSRLLPEQLQQLLGSRGQPESIRDKVVFLHARGSEDMQPLGNVLNGTPALILDHDHDSLGDLDAQRWQAKQVADFFSYVQQLKEMREALQPSASRSADDTATMLRAQFESLKNALLRSTEDSVEAQKRVFQQMEEIVTRAKATVVGAVL